MPGHEGKQCLNKAQRRPSLELKPNLAFNHLFYLRCYVCRTTCTSPTVAADAFRACLVEGPGLAGKRSSSVAKHHRLGGLLAFWPVLSSICSSEEYWHGRGLRTAVGLLGFKDQPLRCQDDTTGTSAAALRSVSLTE